jgi:hypothetical protein
MPFANCKGRMTARQVALARGGTRLRGERGSVTIAGVRRSASNADLADAHKPADSRRKALVGASRPPERIGF